MGRKLNICGMHDNGFRNLFNAVIVDKNDQHVVLGGKAFSAMVLGWNADPLKCFQLFITPSWAPNTSWLSLRHGDGNWDSFPCIVSDRGLRHALRTWALPDTDLRWIRSPTKTVEGYESRAASSVRDSNYTRRNYASKFSQGNCLALFHDPRPLTGGYFLSLQASPHTYGPSRNLKLLSARPLTDRLADLAEAVGHLRHVDLPTLDKTFGELTDEYRVALGALFAEYGDRYVTSTPSPLSRELKNRILRADDDEGNGVRKIRARLREKAGLPPTHDGYSNFALSAEDRAEREVPEEGHRPISSTDGDDSYTAALRSEPANDSTEVEPTEPVCSGECLRGTDVGVSIVGNPIAYAHPDCPKHGLENNLPPPSEVTVEESEGDLDEQTIEKMLDEEPTPEEEEGL